MDMVKFRLNLQITNCILEYFISMPEEIDFRWGLNKL